MICIKCKNEIGDVKFCPECGFKKVDIYFDEKKAKSAVKRLFIDDEPDDFYDDYENNEPISTIFCINCGNKIDDANFCSKCGTSNVGTVPDSVHDKKTYPLEKMTFGKKLRNIWYDRYRYRWWVVIGTIILIVASIYITDNIQVRSLSGVYESDCGRYIIEFTKDGTWTWIRGNSFYRGTYSRAGDNNFRLLVGGFGWDWNNVMNVYVPDALNRNTIRLDNRYNSNRFGDIPIPSIEWFNRRQ
jgi:hypothetical protein